MSTGSAATNGTMATSKALTKEQYDAMTEWARWKGQRQTECPAEFAMRRVAELEAELKRSKKVLFISLWDDYEPCAVIELDQGQEGDVVFKAWLEKKCQDLQAEGYAEDELPARDEYIHVTVPLTPSSKYKLSACSWCTKQLPPGTERITEQDFSFCCDEHRLLWIHRNDDPSPKQEGKP